MIAQLNPCIQKISQRVEQRYLWLISKINFQFLRHWWINGLCGFLSKGILGFWRFFILRATFFKLLSFDPKLVFATVIQFCFYSCCFNRWLHKLPTVWFPNMFCFLLNLIHFPNLTLWIFPLFHFLCIGNLKNRKLRRRTILRNGTCSNPKNANGSENKLTRK